MASGEIPAKKILLTRNDHSMLKSRSEFHFEIRRLNFTLFLSLFHHAKQQQPDNYKISHFKNVIVYLKFISGEKIRRKKKLPKKKKIIVNLIMQNKN